MEDEILLQQWKRKRQITIFLSMIQAFIYGLEFQGIIISASYYLKKTMNISHPQFYYGLVVGGINLSAMLSSIILGKHMDSMRNCRSLILGTVFLSIIGNLLYSLPFSPWLLIVGRFLCGITDATMPAFTGKMFLLV